MYRASSACIGISSGLYKVLIVANASVLMNHYMVIMLTQKTEVLCCLCVCVWGGGTAMFNVPPISDAIWRRLLPYSSFQKTRQAK